MWAHHTAPREDEPRRVPGVCSPQEVHTGTKWAYSARGRPSGVPPGAEKAMREAARGEYISPQVRTSRTGMNCSQRTDPREP